MTDPQGRPLNTARAGSRSGGTPASGRPSSAPRRSTVPGSGLKMVQLDLGSVHTAAPEQPARHSPNAPASATPQSSRPISSAPQAGRSAPPPAAQPSGRPVNRQPAAGAQGRPAGTASQARRPTPAAQHSGSPAPAAPQGRRGSAPPPARQAPRTAARPPAAAPGRPANAVPRSRAEAGPRRPAGSPEDLERRRRAAAHKARERRRTRRRMALLGTVVMILVVSGVINWLLPGEAIPSDPDTVPTAPPGTNLVAPLPYGGSGGGSDAHTVDWGAVGPQRQTENYSYTDAPAPARADGALPEFGKVDTRWFADAAFLGDSLTVGFMDYKIDVDGALICAYTGASPSQIARRTTLKHSQRGEEVPLDVLAQNQPAKVYVLLGTNSLLEVGSGEGFLTYYGVLLDELRAAVPQAAIFVQSVLPARPEAVEEHPGLAADQLGPVNAALSALCAEKGCYYIALNEAFTGDDGFLLEKYAAPDGIHLTPSGYRNWVDYLCRHVPYDKDNPYQAGSVCYLDESVRALLADLP